MKKIVNKRVILKKPELLAPAGNLSRLKIAIRYGADAVFIGGKDYSLRANAKNFSVEDMIQAVQFAKSYDAKIYVTSNIFAHENDFSGYIEYVQRLEEIGINGIIVADPSYIKITRDNTTNLETHLSTQQSTLNSDAINFWASIGCERVVLGREVSSDELKNIMKNSNCEVEAFIHGAMCMSYSGKCTLSNHFTARDSNRGGCVQSCRWDYKLVSNNQIINTNEDFSFSAKDLALINSIGDFIEYGVDSLKIEGRMKSEYYIANIIRTYRAFIDNYCADPDNFVLDEKYYNDILKSANRSVGEHYYLNRVDMSQQIYGSRNEHPSQEFVAICLDNNDDNWFKLQQRNVICIGDKLEVFGPNQRSFVFVVEAMKTCDNLELIRANHPMMEFYIKCDKNIEVGDFIRKTD